ncbi:MAG: VOC family protein [Candidatus Dormibacteria bacterium]
MAETKTATLNKPGWLDLSSQDPAGSRDFYTKLFGWTVDIADDPQYGGYGMFKVDGNEIAGVGAAMNPQQPTAWTVYVIVDDADAAVGRIQQAGGNVIAPPFDVGDQGRMAIVSDPAGAVFGLWQGIKMFGWETYGVTGAVCWSELTSQDFAKAKPFYADVFGWVARDAAVSTPDMQYTTFALDAEDQQGFAGGMQAPPTMPAGTPSYWQAYFAVDNADASAARAKELGGVVMVEPTDIPNTGRFAIIRDPQGGVFGVLQPLPM